MSDVSNALLKIWQNITLLEQRELELKESLVQINDKLLHLVGTDINRPQPYAPGQPVYDVTIIDSMVSSLNQFTTALAPGTAIAINAIIGNIEVGTELSREKIDIRVAKLIGWTNLCTLSIGLTKILTNILGNISAIIKGKTKNGVSSVLNDDLTAVQINVNILSSDKRTKIIDYYRSDKWTQISGSEIQESLRNIRLALINFTQSDTDAIKTRIIRYGITEPMIIQFKRTIGYKELIDQLPLNGNESISAVGKDRINYIFKIISIHDSNSDMSVSNMVKRAEYDLENTLTDWEAMQQYEDIDGGCCNHLATCLNITCCSCCNPTAGKAKRTRKFIDKYSNILHNNDNEYNNINNTGIKSIFDSYPNAMLFITCVKGYTLGNCYAIFGYSFYTISFIMQIAIIVLSGISMSFLNDEEIARNVLLVIIVALAGSSNFCLIVGKFCSTNSHSNKKDGTRAYAGKYNNDDILASDNNGALDQYGGSAEKGLGR